MSLSAAVHFGLNDKKVIAAISELYKQTGYRMDDARCRVSTREISEVAGINIYQARYSLLKLKACGVIIQVDAAPKRMLYWRPAAFFPVS